MEGDPDLGALRGYDDGPRHPAPRHAAASSVGISTGMSARPSLACSLARVGTHVRRVVQARVVWSDNDAACADRSTSGVLVSSAGRDECRGGGEDGSGCDGKEAYDRREIKLEPQR